MMNFGIAKILVLGAIVVALGVFAMWRNAAHHPRTLIAEIVVPTLSAEARAGEAAFNENCVACHGRNGAGTEQGPPLIHEFLPGSSRRHGFSSGRATRCAPASLAVREHAGATASLSRGCRQDHRLCPRGSGRERHSLQKASDVAAMRPQEAAMRPDRKGS